MSGDRTIGGVLTPSSQSPLSSRPRSSLPIEVLRWLAQRLAHLCPARRGGQGGTPPLPLEVRLDALGAVVLDGLSYRRAARMVGICKTEVGDSLDLLLGELAALGLCQPDGTFVATLQNLRERLAEMTEVGEAVCVDGLATRVQRPGRWANQKVLDDAKRRTHTAQGVALSTIHGDLLWCDGGWPGSCHEHELLEVSGVRSWTPPASPPWSTGDSEGWPRPARAGTRRSGTDAPTTSARRPNATTTASRPGCAPRWSRRSGIWPTRGRCGAGVACCTGSGTSTGPPRRSSASADGSTASRHERSIRTSSLTTWSTML